MNVPLSRRTALRSGAWAVPVVSLATAAPASAVSMTCTAPVTPILSAANWTFEDHSPGRHNSQTGTRFEAGGWWSRDDTLRGQTVPSVETITSFVDVVAGCTYTFSYRASKIQNNGPNQPNHTPQTVELLVGDALLAMQTTDETSTTLPVLYTSLQTFSGTYTALETGTIPLQFRFTLMPPAAGMYGNDDIQVKDFSITAA